LIHLREYRGLIGPLLAWPLLDAKYIRRRGTLAIGAVLTMAFFFGYTQVKNGTQNLIIRYISAGYYYPLSSRLIACPLRSRGVAASSTLSRVSWIGFDPLLSPSPVSHYIPFKFASLLTCTAPFPRTRTYCRLSLRVLDHLLLIPFGLD
jgi:hypothetical protein